MKLKESREMVFAQAPLVFKRNYNRKKTKYMHDLLFASVVFLRRVVTFW